MGGRELMEQRSRFRRQCEFHPSAVTSTGRFRQQSGLDHARNELGRRMRRDEQLLGHEANRRRRLLPGDGQQRLMLLCRQTEPARCLFAESEKAPEFPAESRNGGIVRREQPFRLCITH